MTDPDPIRSPETPTLPPPRAPHAFSLREKAPELAVEAASVVFAVLLALGVDQWREGRLEQRRADRARDSIFAEIQSNRAELQGSIVGNQTVVARIDSARAALEADREGSIEFNFSFAVLSSAAWNAAQMTGATQPLPFDWLIAVSGIYEGQALYLRSAQDVIARLPATVAALERGEGARALYDIRTALGIEEDLAAKLLATYDSLLLAENRTPQR